MLAYSSKKGLNLSRSRQLADFVQQAQTQRIKSLLDNRVSVVLVIGLFSFIMCIDVILGRSEGGLSASIILLKTILALALMAVLGKMLLTSSKAGGDNGVGDIVKENFEVKAITYLVATPDEVANSIIDPVQRTQWDGQLSSAAK